MIKGWRPVAGPPTPVSWERRECLSPNREWRAIYHSPHEWHMGAHGWRLQLLHQERDVTAEHRRLASLAGGRGFRCDTDLHCWSFDSRAFAFLTWDDEPVHIYEMSTREVRKIATGANPAYSAQWSPATDRLLVTMATGALLVDRNGTGKGAPSWQTAPYEVFYTYWMKDGASFFLLARASNTSVSPAGFEAARALGERLAAFPIAAIYSSPHRRAIETIATLADRLGITPHLIADLRERELPPVGPDEFEQIVEETWRTPDAAVRGGESNCTAQVRGALRSSFFVLSSLVLSSPQSAASLVVASPKPSSVTPIRSISER